MDIIAKLVTKKRNITLGRVILYTDICIISSSILLPNGSIEKVIFGLVCMAVSTLTIDMVVNGVRQSVQFFIFSSEYEKIADAITHQLGRGVTVLDGIGWYSKEHVAPVGSTFSPAATSPLNAADKNADSAASLCLPPCMLNTFLLISSLLFVYHIAARKRKSVTLVRRYTVIIIIQ